MKVDNVDATINVPDGMNITSISIVKNSDQHPIFQYEYIDGSKSESFDQEHILVAPAAKFIKKVHIHFDHAAPDAELFDVNLMGVLADKYRGDHDNSAIKNTDQKQPNAGDKVSDLDKLITSVTVALSDSKNNSGYPWTCEQFVFDKNPDTTIQSNQINIEKRQKSKQVGNKNAGYISINQWHFGNVTPDVTYYVVLPKNTTLNMENPFSNLPRITDSANYQRREDLAI